jgi:Cu/Ag efflux protein CusF
MQPNPLMQSNERFLVVNGEMSMKAALAAVVLGALIATSGASRADEQMKNMKDMDKPGSPAAAAVHKATGVVKSVRPDKGEVTLQHGPVQSLNWPAMTMAFGVKDKALLGRLPIGKKVEFEFVQERSKYVVTKVK